MSINIIDLAKQYLTPSTISQVSQEVGESESTVSKAINAFVPIILGGLVEKNSSAGGLLHSLKSFGASKGLNSLSTTTETSPVLNTILNTIFGSSKSTIIDKVASFAGLSSDSSSKLFNVASEAVLGSVGKYASDHNLGESEFSSLLDVGKSSLLSLIPAGLGLGSLGLGSIFGSDRIETPKVEAPKVETYTRKVETEENIKPYVAPTYEEENKSSIWKWLLPLLLLLLGGYLIWHFLKKPKTEVETTNTQVENVDTVTTTVVTPTIGDINLDGVNLKGYVGGFEEQLISFIKSPEYANATEDQLKEKWFNFDNVNFVFGTTDQLEEGSQVQLENLSQILKKYPDAKIKIGAYTDKVGDDANNKALSQKRSNFIKAELEKLGVGAQVIGAEGYGEEFAVVDEGASDEERASDRKMSVRFSK
ncbi:MAG: DUF937 domain-containing protein [Weeksellaceae bacterium]|nr:DUF937 domain-containing protein [Weeksellaceae bacterium]